MSYSLLGAHANATVAGMPEVIAAWKPPLVVVLDHSDVWHQVKAASPKTTFVGRVYIPYQPDFNNPDLPPIQTARDHCTQVLPWAERMGSTYSFWQGVNEPIVNSHEAMQRYSDFEAERPHHRRRFSQAGHHLDRHRSMEQLHLNRQRLQAGVWRRRL